MIRARHNLLGSLTISILIPIVVSIFCLSFTAGFSRLAFSEVSGIELGRYHALIIGNDAYIELPKLKSATRDAVTVSKLLGEKYGFKIRLLTDATRGDILGALNDYREQLTESDNLLIYYAGHGWLDQRTNTGFWQPVDAAADNDINWIPNAEITRRLNAITARHVMVVADSCYSGALVRSGDQGLVTGEERTALLQRLTEKRSRTAIVSGGLEPVVDSGQGGHSVFANAFLAALRENDKIIEGAALFRHLRRSVIVNASQTPQYSDIRNAGHEGGEFVFKPKDAEVALASPTVDTPTANVDEQTLDHSFWESAKDSDDPVVFEAYLEQFPEGIYVVLARLKLAELTKKDELVPASVSKASPVARVQVDTMDMVLIASANANIRALPSEDSQRLSTASEGTGVAVTGKVKDAEWYRVVHEGEDAYIHASLLHDQSTWEKIRQDRQVKAAATQSRQKVEEVERHKAAGVIPGSE